MLRKKFLSGFWDGFLAPVESLRLILRSPKLITLVAVPLILNILLYALFFRFGAKYLNDGIILVSTQLASQLPTWLAATAIWLLKFLGWILLITIAALSFTVVSGLVCSPFNDHLSRHTVAYYLKKKAPHKEFHTTTLSTAEVVKLEFKRMAILIIGGIATLLLGLVPFLQIPAFCFGAYLLAFEYFGYPFSQKTKDLSRVMRFILAHPMVSLGFGSFLMLVMILPFTSIFYIPLAVTGSSLLFAKLERL